MSVLLIPIAPLSRTKSRLRNCFGKEELKDLTICMFKDLCNKLSNIKIFDNIVVYCNDREILKVAEKFNLIGIKEELTKPRKSFDEVINDLNLIAIEQFHAQKTVFTFLDTILISPKNFQEINTLIQNNQLVVCPAIHSAGISVLGRNPPDIIPTYFSEPTIPSLIAQVHYAKQNGLSKIKIYDSFRAGFDIDIKQDLVLAYEYLKILGLTHTHTYKFLDKNLNISIQKSSSKNNRIFQFKKK